MAASTLMALVTIATACVAMATGAPADAQIANKYQDFDVDKVLGNDRILTNYIRCLMDQGACTSEGRELKKTIPDALAGGCSQCSEKQRQTSERVIKHLMDNRKTDWDRLLKKYDPKGIYETQFQKLLMTPQKTAIQEPAKAAAEKSAKLEEAKATISSSPSQAAKVKTAVKSK